MSSPYQKISPQSDSVSHFFSPLRIFSHLWKHHYLIWQLTARGIKDRYQGSILGFGWAFINPLVMLAVYTFVFSVVFKGRWGTSPEESTVAFALNLFAGIITYNIFSETANAAPQLILNNVNYIKKVFFPLEILPLISFLIVFFNTIFSLVILFIGLIMFDQQLHGTVLLLPLAWLPIILFSLGCSYFLASLGVFIRDIGATVQIITTILFFMSPIFYPIHAIPPQYQFLCRINPIAIFVDNTRRVMLWGEGLELPWYLGSLFLSLIIFILGFAWFIKSKKAFADVV